MFILSYYNSESVIRHALTPAKNNIQEEPGFAHENVLQMAQEKKPLAQHPAVIAEAQIDSQCVDQAALDRPSEVRSECFRTGAVKELVSDGGLGDD